MPQSQQALPRGKALYSQHRSTDLPDTIEGETRDMCRLMGALAVFWSAIASGTLAVAQTSTLQYGPPLVGLNILYRLGSAPNRYARFVITRVEGDSAYVSRSAWEGESSGSGKLNQATYKYGQVSQVSGECADINLNESEQKSIAVGAVAKWERRCRTSDGIQNTKFQQRVVGSQAAITPSGTYETIVIERTSEYSYSAAQKKNHSQFIREFYFPKIGFFVKQEQEGKDENGNRTYIESFTAISVRY